MNTMSERIKELIEVLNISKTEFADKINRSTGNVSDWLSGRAKPSKNTMKMICQVLNVSYEWLSEGEGEMFVLEKEELTYELSVDEEILLDMYREMSKEAKKEIQLSARNILRTDKEVAEANATAKSKQYPYSEQTTKDELATKISS